MPHGISMRWWLALVFAVVAGVTAAVVVWVVTTRTESTFRERAEGAALTDTRAAAQAIRVAVARGDKMKVVGEVARRRDLAVFLLDAQGRPVTETRSNLTELASVPRRAEAVQAAIEGRQFVATLRQGQATVTALPMPWEGAAVVLTYAVHPGYGVTMSVFREQVVTAAALAFAVAALLGFVVASLMARRVRRIGAAASAIERGDFSVALNPRFHDEIGTLAEMIDRMSMRLQESIGRVDDERLRLRRVLERLDQGVVTFDSDLRVELFNAAASRLLGSGSLAEGDMLPEPWPDFPLRSFAEALFADGAVATHARTAPDDAHAFTVWGVPAGRAHHTAILVVTDVSESERRERVEREFVTNAAHELRTPLTAIRSAIDVLQSGAKESPLDRDRFLAVLERQTGRLDRLGRSLLVLARAQSSEEAPPLQPVALCPLLEEIVTSLRARDGVDVAADCPPGLYVHAETELVEQVLTNVAGNAAKHTKRGRIDLKARAGTDGFVVIEIVDTGPGIALADRPRVAERFFRGESRDADGFGLGLAIARQAVRVLGGRMDIDPAPGPGTTVRISLRESQSVAA